MKSLKNTETIDYRKVGEEVDKVMQQKVQKLNRKFDKLIEKKSNFEKPTVLTVPEYTTNLSSVEFTTEEMETLNKGLNFTPRPEGLNISTTIVDIETSIKYLRDFEKETVRKAVRPVLKNALITARLKPPLTAKVDILANLKSKDVYYLKADKGNKMVIMDRSEYDKRMEKMMEESSFKEVKRNPLSGMTQKSIDLRKEIAEKLEIPKWKLKVHNPKLPFLYGLPKIHKIGNKMRPVLSSFMSPFYKLAKWVTKEFNEIKQQPPGCHVKNVYEFVETIQHTVLEEDEIMVSYDVTSLYPNIPIPEALQIINDWLFESDLSDSKADLLLRTTRVCMQQNFFQYKGKYYKQTFGANMGNPLSCFVANTFLGSIEQKLKNNGMLPRVWVRYVDDVFAVIKKTDEKKWLNILNEQSPTIKFTMEKETNGKLPFLDVMVTRVNNKLDFSVYRKPTNTDRYITRDSYCTKSTKLAAFNSMVYRLLRLPLSIVNYMEELKNIKRIANINGYTEEEIETLVNKQSRKLKKAESSTLFSQKTEEKQTRVSFTFNHTITNHLKPIFKRQNIEMVFGSNNKLRDVLGNPKDKVEDHQKSGIYQILCQNCNKLYIGQSRRAILTRFKEHCAHIKYNRPTKSAVAAHALNENHLEVKSTNLKMIKQTRKVQQLDGWESIHIHKNKNQLMNNVQGPISSSLFNFIKIRNVNITAPTQAKHVRKKK